MRIATFIFAGFVCLGASALCVVFGIAAIFALLFGLAFPAVVCTALSGVFAIAAASAAEDMFDALDARKWDAHP